MIRLLPTFLLAASPLLAADLKIDHVTVAGDDLKALQAGLRKVGIESVYGGPHSNHATEMAIVSFPDGSYLELMGIQPDADPHAVQSHAWSKYLTGNAGPCAWAVRQSDIAAEVKRLRGAGVKVSEPEDGGRQRPDGVRLSWQTSNVGEGDRGHFFPFLIQDKTPREQRVYPQGKPISREYRGISRVVIAVRNLDDAVKRYRAAYGLPAPIKQVDAEFGAQLALMGGSPVVLAAPLNGQSWLAERIERLGEAPCAFVLAATKPVKSPASKTRWFGAEIGWLDAEWQLGVEVVR
jgi:hypothetical protein